jgi:hypothetical protein
MSAGPIRFIPTRALALAKALELQRLLQEVVERPEYGEGSCPEAALDYLEDVIAHLIEDEVEKRERQST